MKGARFQHLKERLSKRLKDYTDKNMFAAAKEVLIKAVAQALPAYSMSVFKLPMGLCDDLTSIIREFWWGVENGKRKTAFQGPASFQPSNVSTPGLEADPVPGEPLR